MWIEITGMCVQSCAVHIRDRNEGLAKMLMHSKQEEKEKIEKHKVRYIHWSVTVIPLLIND